MGDPQEVTCIVCTVGCTLSVVVEGDRADVSGHQCDKGVEYGKQEALDPRRIVTSSVLVLGGEWPLASVRTSQPVPKDKVMEVMKEIRSVRVKTPVNMGDVLIGNVAGTLADVVATRAVLRE